MKMIPLTQGYFATVDDRDYAQLRKFNWCAHVKPQRTVYAKRRGKTKQMDMHVQILGLQPGTVIDHRDGNGLNNRRRNLRRCRVYQNVQNQRRRSTNTSGFKGVSWNKNCEKWIARIMARYKSVFLGYFSSRRAAARAYNEAAIRLHGPFARLNPI